jgi:hypothetical protein
MERMDNIIRWLEEHDKLAGWAQFFGAVLALAITYFTAFVPIWHRKRQLKNAASRLLLNGFETLESYHRTTQNFLPEPLALQGAVLVFGRVIDEISHFPVYELDDQSGGSAARQLIAVNSILIAARLAFENLASVTEGRIATADERDMLVEFLGNQLELVRKMLAGEKLTRPVWPGAAEGS